VHTFPDLYTPMWVAALVLLVVLVVLYNVRTRALHRHAVYLDMWEWLLWTGHLAVRADPRAPVFNFYLIVLLVILDHGLAVMVWVRVRPLPAAVRGVRAEAGEAALLHPHEVRPPGVDDPAEGRPEAGAARGAQRARRPEPQRR
jgi:hypothetical protein